MDGRPATRVGYWMTEKKYRRLHFEKFVTLCRNAGIELIKIDFDQPLEAQGPFSVILHKITDQVAQVKEGNRNLIAVFQSYIDDHPEILVIDPIDNVMRLLDRRHQYQDVKDCDVIENSCHYFIPSFVELASSDVDENKRLLQENDVRFPCVCKPSISHLSVSSTDRDEQMAIIFNEERLTDVKVPCVAQSFVNHNARLFKIFVIGQKHFVIQRPSIRNFYDCNQETIFFNSNDVSKSNSSSVLNQLDESDLLSHPLIEPDCQKMELFVQGIQKKFGLELLGIDVIIENDTGRYAVIDINAFPGYDGVPEFFNALLQLILEKIVISDNLAAAYNYPKDAELWPNFPNSVSKNRKVDDDEGSEARFPQYTEADLSKDSMVSDKLLSSKECSFLPQSTHFFYRPMPEKFSHPALCACYRDLTAPGIVTVSGRDQTAVINHFSLL